MTWLVLQMNLTHSEKCTWTLLYVHMSLKNLIVDLLCLLEYPTIRYTDRLMALQNPLNQLVNVILRMRSLLHITNEENMEILILVNIKKRAHNNLMPTDRSFMHQKYSWKNTQKYRTIH